MSKRHRIKDKRTSYSNRSRYPSLAIGQSALRWDGAIVVRVFGGKNRSKYLPE